VIAIFFFGKFHKFADGLSQLSELSISLSVA
jgi:hypothetical protein